MTKLNKSPGIQVSYLRLFGTIITIGLFIILLSGQGWEEIGRAFSEIPFWRFLLALALIFTSRIAVAVRWHVLLQAAKVGNSWGQTLRITFAGLFASNFLPTTIGGDIIRLAGALQYKFDSTISAASLVVDRLIGMFGMAIVLPFGLVPLLIWFDSDQFTNNPSLLLSLNAGKYIIRWWQKGKKLLNRILKSIGLWMQHPKALLISFMFTSLHMLLLFTAISLLLDGLDDSLSVGLIAGLWSFVYFVTLLPVSINGFGVQEISITYIFSSVGGTSLQSGMTIAILLRTLMMIASLPGALFVPTILAGRQSQKEKQCE